MTDATSIVSTQVLSGVLSDPTTMLFGLEEEFSVLAVDRCGPWAVKVIIEQIARDGPCPECGVLSSVVKDRPLIRIKDLPASGQAVQLWWRKRLSMRRGPVPALVVHPDRGGGAAAWPAHRTAPGQDRIRDRRQQPIGRRCRRRVPGVLADRAQGAGRGCGPLATRARTHGGAGDRRDPVPIGPLAS